MRYFTMLVVMGLLLATVINRLSVLFNQKTNMSEWFDFAVRRKRLEQRIKEIQKEAEYEVYLHYIRQQCRI